MHVCLVTETYPPEINGVALTVKMLAEGLAAAGHRVQLVRPRQRTETIKDPLPVHFSRGIRLPRYPGLQLGLPDAYRLRRHWSRHRPDIIYVATEGPLGASALSAAESLALPAVSGFHTRFDSYAAHYGVRWLRPWVQAWLRRFHGRSQATLVPTQQLAAELRQLGINNPRLLRRAVDTQLFQPSKRDARLRQQWGLTGDAPAVLLVGRIAPEKNLQLAIQSWHAIRAQRPDSRCIWVGDGPQRATLAAAHPDIHFTGSLRGETLARHYASADLFIFPSQSETFGNVVLEAMASGLAVLAYDLAAAHEHIQHGRSGLLATAGDCAEFIKLSSLLVCQPQLSRELGRQARASVIDLAPQQVIDSFAELLHAICLEYAHGSHSLQTSEAA